MRTLFVCLFLLFGTSLSRAESGRLYYHNGSVVSMRIDGKRVAIHYLNPRRRLPDFVQPGTLLFDGVVNERSGRIEGTAWIFNSHCGRGFPYYVVGDFIDDAVQLVLHGPVPIIDNSCRIIGSTWKNSNAELIFDIVAE